MDRQKEQLTRKYNSCRYNVEHGVMVLESRALGFEGGKWLFWQKRKYPGLFDMWSDNNDKTLYIQRRQQNENR